MAANSREIRMLERALGSANLHPHVAKVLVQIVEDNHAMKQQIMQLASLFDGLINNQIRQAQAVGKLQALEPHIRKMKELGLAVGSDPTLTGEHDET